MSRRIAFVVRRKLYILTLQVIVAVISFVFFRVFRFFFACFDFNCLQLCSSVTMHQPNKNHTINKSFIFKTFKCREAHVGACGRRQGGGGLKRTLTPEPSPHPSVAEILTVRPPGRMARPLVNETCRRSCSASWQRGGGRHHHHRSRALSASLRTFQHLPVKRTRTWVANSLDLGGRQTRGKPSPNPTVCQSKLRERCCPLL